jgi:hypothetical protein
MLSFNEEKFGAVVEIALTKVSDNRRWSSAISKASEMLTSPNPYFHFTGDALLMLSDSGEIYEANGVCQCKAFLGGNPCKHRAAFKLVKRYFESV